MSHFTVLVVTKTFETEELEAALQPFHEYECTDIDDEYVIDVDKTEEVEKWLVETLFVGKDEAGKLDYHYTADKAAHVCKEFTEMTRREFYELDKRDIEDEIKDWFGYKKREGKYYQHTNPNAKWDWWIVGGRWTGFFDLKPGKVGELGRPGVMTPNPENGRFDRALKKDIDFDHMKKTEGEKAEREWDKAQAIIDGREFKTWGECREANENPQDAREAYGSQQVIKDFREAFGPFNDIEKYCIPKEEFVRSAQASAYSTFAVLMDGEWKERGSMGWWGIVTDGKDNWEGDFLDLMDSIPEDAVLTVVDCHI